MYDCALLLQHFYSAVSTTAVVIPSPKYTTRATYSYCVSILKFL